MKNSTPYSVALTGGVFNTNVSVSDDDATLEDLYKEAGTPTELDVTAEEYHTYSREKKSRIKKTLRYFVGAVLKGPRHDENVVARTMVTMDIERNKNTPAEPPSPQTIASRLRALGESGWIYTSIGHTPEHPRYRVVLPLVEPITAPTPAQAAKVLEYTTRTAAKRLGLENWLDTVSWTLSQPMYLPAKLRDGHFYQKYISGRAWGIVATPVNGYDLLSGKKPPADIPDKPLDPVLLAIKAAGLYLRENPKHPGMHFITCPHGDEHTTKSDSKTAYYEAHFDGNPRPAVKCMGTGPDEDGKPHLTYASLVRWLKKDGHLTQEQQSEVGVLDDYETFDEKASIHRLLDREPVAREWAVDRFAPTGKVTVLAGPGGVSKSMFMLHLLLYASTGRSWAGFSMDEPVRSLYVSYEDDLPELHKRIHTLASALRSEDSGTFDLLYDVNGSIQRNIRMFAADSEAASWLLLTKPDRFGQPTRSERVEWLIGYLRSRHIKLLCLDPAVYTHQLEENSVADMASYMQMLTHIAKTAECAVVVLHHMHKAAGWASLDEINQGSLRGASSFADNARSVGVLVSMPIKDAEAYGLPIDTTTSSRYAVLKHVKHNYSAPLDTMVFERKGALLVHRPEITKLGREQLAEVVEATKQAENERQILRWTNRVLEVLNDCSAPISLNHVSVELKTRSNRIKPVLEYCEQQDLIETEHGPNRSILHSITKAGKQYLKQQKGT